MPATEAPLSAVEQALVRTLVAIVVRELRAGRDTPDLLLRQLEAAERHQ